MEWFKHRSTASDGDTLRIVLYECGARGYGIFWLLNEMVARTMDETDRCDLEVPWAVAERMLHTRRASAEQLLGICRDNSTLQFETRDRKGKPYLWVRIPKLLDLRDEWTRRLRSNSGVAPENLRSNSRATPDRSEKRREDKSDATKVTALPELEESFFAAMGEPTKNPWGRWLEPTTARYWLRWAWANGMAGRYTKRGLRRAILSWWSRAKGFDPDCLRKSRQWCERVDAEIARHPNGCPKPPAFDPEEEVEIRKAAESLEINYAK